MFTLIKNWLHSQHQTDLDRYISSRNPQNPADIDILIKEFTYKTMNGWYQL